MSFFKYMFDNELLQRSDIEYLENEVEELDLPTSALMQILMDKHGPTPEELSLAIVEVRQQEADAERKQQTAEEARAPRIR